MATETKPLPELAKSAFQLLQANFQRGHNDLATQTLAVMGLTLDAGWVVNFQSGNAERPVTEPPAEPPA